MSGPLRGLKVVEFVGLGAAPFCAMLLADLGAEVVRIDRPGGNEMMRRAGVVGRFDTMARTRRSLAIDLKKPGAVDVVLRLVERTDILLEGFRPGVMERIGLGPEICLDLNPRLVYGRLTGWGQSGPLSQAAGHDINYIALSGVLNALPRSVSTPVPPMNLLGDFAGGGLLMAYGLLAAIYAVRDSGVGQVVDTAMAEGASLFATMDWGIRAKHSAAGDHDEGKSSAYDGSCPYYASYECADGKCVSVAAAEPQFYALLRRALDLNTPLFEEQNDTKAWPEQKAELTRLFKSKTRAEWCELLQSTDLCFAPVLAWDEALEHPHNIARQAFVNVDGVAQPAPAPKFSRTPPKIPSPVVAAGADTERVLRDWGIGADLIQSLRLSGAI